ncbi:MAG: xanthine dehydrogenase family protein subunit M [Dehalococcoidia bacterium]|nr:xanthine dehydrogenase family protein subunit M [Dehalococcoidia bacterium]
MFPASFDYHAPTTVPEALRLLAENGPDAKLLAGGHSLLPAMKLRLLEPGCLVDIGRIPELRGIRREGQTLVIGAATLHADIATSDVVRQAAPGLATAASLIGDVQVRNRGTIGGSAAHDDPAADYPVILTALDASFMLVSSAGARTVASGDFFLDYFTTALSDLEIITEVRIPGAAASVTSAYAKLEHPASGFLVVSAGVRIERGADGRCRTARIAIGGLGGRPFRATAVESALAGHALTPAAIAAAAALAADGSDPDGDAYAPAEYRRHMATVYVQRALEAAL